MKTKHKPNVYPLKVNISNFNKCKIDDAAHLSIYPTQDLIFLGKRPSYSN